VNLKRRHSPPLMPRAALHLLLVGHLSKTEAGVRGLNLGEYVIPDVVR
jgi:hypothetical protein